VQSMTLAPRPTNQFLLSRAEQEPAAAGNAGRDIRELWDSEHGTSECYRQPNSSMHFQKQSMGHCQYAFLSCQLPFNG
jgi:hypothetical protein